MQRTIIEEAYGDYEEKKSKFLAYVYPIQSEDEAKDYIQQLKKDHFKARHHCSAYRLMTSYLSEHSSDDGEPSGTAGRPMLDILRHEQLVNVLVVVVRYFGGIKLGTGGLARAYSQATKEALKAACYYEKKEQCIYKAVVPYAHYDSLIYYLNQHHLYYDHVEYDEQITLSIYFDTDDSEEITLLQHQFLAIQFIENGVRDIFIPIENLKV